MKIGIDISQILYKGAGVAEYLDNLVSTLLEIDNENEYVLFFSSLRGKVQHTKFTPSASSGQESQRAKVTIKTFKFPPFVLDFMWNRLHILPIEYFIGDVDVFISSDWTQPPVSKAKNVTILYDLIVFKHPEETAKSIIATQKRKLSWSKKECDKILCISDATKRDAMEILNIPEEKLEVVYPGMTL